MLFLKKNVRDSACICLKCYIFALELRIQTQGSDAKDNRIYKNAWCG